MRKESIVIITAFSLVLIAVSMLVAVSMVTSDVIGANQTDTITKVWVWNTEPNLYSVVVNPSPIDLTPGEKTVVNCTGYVWDYNGWQDVNISNATFYHDSVSHNSGDDNNNHYTVNVSNNCSCIQRDGSATNLSCTCLFDVWYYANNGTWICNLTVQDEGGNATERIHRFNSSNNASATINTVVALDTPSELDYGNLSVTETSDEKALNISNFGNVVINISVRGYGGTDPNESDNKNNLSMVCDYGNITVEYERYSLESGTAYSSMTELRNQSLEIGMQLPIRTNDSKYDDDTNTTYWRLDIPLTVGGNCNGTLVFSANQAP